MKINNHRSSLPCRIALLLVIGTCFGAVQLVSGQVEIGPRAKPGNKPVPKAAPKVGRSERSSPSTVDLGGGVRLEMVTLDSGSFWMGSDNGGPEEKPFHRVTITRSFGIGKYEVTQDQWVAVMGSNPSQFKPANSYDTLPVETVSWSECQEFIRRLNAKTGMKFRLPTEAEWEYACRAGKASDWAGDLDSMGWFYRNAGRSELDEANWSHEAPRSNGNRTHAVGQKQPNGWGLYDMHGNVFEWCQDWYDESYYRRSPDADPTGATGGSSRTIRGGSYGTIANACRSAFRSAATPDSVGSDVGFRLARTQ